VGKRRALSDTVSELFVLIVCLAELVTLKQIWFKVVYAQAICSELLDFFQTRQLGMYW
jgi:hypothetical protein